VYTELYVPSQVGKYSVNVIKSLSLNFTVYDVMGDPLKLGKSQVKSTLSPLIVETGAMG